MSDLAANLRASNDQPTRDQVLASLDRILGSEEFADSAQLSRFLRYVVESRLSNENQDLKESVIGVTVFRRPLGYDPKIDPIVRVEARRLRSRLDSYYEVKGSTDPVRISLPKGGYSPAFEILSLPALFAPETCAVDESPALTPQLVASGRRLRWLVVAGIPLVAGAVIAWMVYRAGATDRLPSRFWASILDSERSALIVPADSGLTMLQDMVHRPVQLGDYLTGEHRTRMLDQIHVDETPATFAERRYTPYTDLAFAVRLARRPEASRRGVLARFARDIRVEDLKRNNLILLGPRHMNPWVELFEKEATFRLEHDEKTGSYRVVNRAPGPGEIREDTVTLATVRQEIYGIISYHRNREGAGYVLMLSGTSIAGTEAAGDLILDDARLAPWLARAQVHGEGKGFDMLLHGRNLAGSAPRAEIVAFHVDN